MMLMSKQKVFDIVNYSFFSLVIVGCLALTIVFKLNWLTFVACATSILYIVFLSDRNIFNFLVGLVASATYIVVAYKSHIYGEAIFYLAFDIPMILVSFLMWKKHMETKNKVEVRSLKFKTIFAIIIYGTIAVIMYSSVLEFIGGENTIFDALSTVVSIVATLLMAYRYKEQWIMWIVVYAVSIALWLTSFDLLMVVMSASCFVSSIVGYVNWQMSSNRNN